MSRLDRYMADYGSYHADARNELTHAVGIPMIVLSLLMLAGNVPLGEIGGLRLDLGWVLIVAVTAFYVALSPALGVAMGAILAALHLFGHAVLGASVWVAIALFVAGWAFQFVGHYFEGKRPAFFKNGIHLLVGPVYILSRGLSLVGIAPSHGRRSAE
jgi:uncharacterized membrane protein YGL010W